MLALASDQLAEQLDAQKGTSVSDPTIFRAHAAKYEVRTRAQMGGGISCRLVVDCWCGGGGGIRCAVGSSGWGVLVHVRVRVCVAALTGMGAGRGTYRGVARCGAAALGNTVAKLGGQHPQQQTMCSLYVRLMYG